MSSTHPQQNLDLITHEVNNSVIPQRAGDGYINATALCKAAGKQWNEYRSNKATERYLAVVEAKTGIPVLELIQVVTSAGVKSTWVHPKIAPHLGQWLSPEFAYQVSEWIEEWTATKGVVFPIGSSTPPQAGGASFPPHIRRYLLNLPAIPPGHFTVLQEITFILTGPLESLGYELAEHFLPDGSLGKMFCSHLRDVHGYDTCSLPKYTHTFEDGRKVEPKAYPNDLLPIFRKYALETWLPLRAPGYFKERDPKALPFLSQLNAIAAPAKAANLPHWKKPA